jgi:hypothetical protein
LDARRDARQYADEIVDPTIAEYEQDRRSTRKAFLACVVTFHMIDYLGAKQRRKAFRQESPAFATIDRVAHAFKHVTTGNLQDPTLPPLASDQIIERPPANWDQAVWGLSQWDDATGGATIAGEHERDLLTDVRNAAAFLRSKLPS